ncbi:hypothetical protein [Azospirillum doebereinerae]|uniref:hypothetical protein n=1 Tax=Azospirillum doebereinerae TaxID=92933 RepID=UPI00163CDFDE|nr:hypothetical protein [Azospirillum doebereinerae]MCG5243018.1 hypothetical protein [Azospirillum doebereinerae]
MAGGGLSLANLTMQDIMDLARSSAAKAAGAPKAGFPNGLAIAMPVMSRLVIHEAANDL